MNDKLFTSYHDAYRYGAISGIIGCTLALLHIVTWHWFFILVVFYGLGITVWFVKIILKDPLIDQHLELIDAPAVEKPQPFQEKIINHVETQPPSLPQLNRYARLFQDYEKLQYESLPFLNANSRQYMADIQKIMQFIQKKFEQHADDSFKFEIIDIQRTLDAYLMPALQHFSDLPPFLRERKIIDQQSPSQLLEQQLAMILEEFQNISESIYLNDLNKLIDHGQYLKYKLQQPDAFNIALSPMDEPK